MEKKSFVQKCRDHYHIPYEDLADAAESNRLILLNICPLLFLFGLLDVVAVLIIHHSNLKEYVASIVYFSVFTIVSFCTEIYSRKMKDVVKEKAYIYKTIPVYMILHISQGAAVYNFYILNQPFNGFVTYCLICAITLCVFTFSPFPYLIGIVLPVAIMTPGIYKNFGLSGLADSYVVTVIMYYLSLYKRRSYKKHLMFLKKQKQNLVAKTFGNFTLIYENKVIKFNRIKSNELMGYLIYKNGSSVNTKELINILWGEHADSARYGSSFRNLIVDIKHAFNELEIQNFFITEYNSFRINPDIINCDYYDFLAGDSAARKSFTGEFMSQFDWAKDVSKTLEKKALPVKNTMRERKTKR